MTNTISGAEIGLSYQHHMPFCIDWMLSTKQIFIVSLMFIIFNNVIVIYFYVLIISFLYRQFIMYVAIHASRLKKTTQNTSEFLLT